MIVAGFGFRQAARLESLRDAYDRAASGVEVTHVATLSDKASAPIFVDLADMLHVPVLPVQGATVAQAPTVTQSRASQTARQTGSVAEATALVAAGPGAVLIRTRVISADGMATCALARSEKEGEPS